MDDQISEYSFTKPRPQVFSFRSSFTNYFFKNYSSQLYWKLVMSCKKFFAEKRILVVDTVCNEIVGYSVQLNTYPTYKINYYYYLKINKTKLLIIRNIIFGESNKSSVSNLSKYI